ncbi:MAG: helix-turn-helix transcriptional regulator [Rhodospirillaceae bacterium]
MALSDYVSRKDLAARGPIPYSTLKKLARDPAGPPFVRIGDRVFYHVPSVEAWLAAQAGATVATTRRRGRPTKAEQVERQRLRDQSAQNADVAS